MNIIKHKLIKSQHGECSRCGGTCFPIQGCLASKIILSVKEQEFIFSNGDEICPLCIIQLRTKFFIKTKYNPINN